MRLVTVHPERTQFIYATGSIVAGRQETLVTFTANNPLKIDSMYAIVPDSMATKHADNKPYQGVLEINGQNSEIISDNPKFHGC